MASVDLNLLSALGVINKRRLQHSPALTLSDDGTLVIWHSWYKLQKDRKDSKVGQTPTQKSVPYQVLELTKVHKVLYWECEPLPNFESEIRFFLKDPSPTSLQDASENNSGMKPDATLDPLWLAVPEVQKFLSRHVPSGIRNDFDPAHEWRSRHRILTGLWLDKGDRELTNKSQVWSDFGKIIWEHDTKRVQIEVSGWGWLRRHAGASLTLEEGQLIRQD